MLALLAGLIAGVGAWGIGEATHVQEASFHSDKEKIDVPVSVSGTQNALYSYSALGAVLGLILGLTGGFIGRSILKGIAGGILGLILGAAAGGGLSLLILPVYYSQPPGNDLVYSLLTHGSIWLAVGAAAGVAYGVGRGGGGAAIFRGLVIGASAALIATVVYEFGGGIFFPLALTDRPVSHTSESRLVARLLVTVLVASAVILAGEVPMKAKTNAEPTAAA
jgi:hypothetical protein